MSIPASSPSDLSSTSHSHATEAVNQHAHTRVEECYQCGKCTAGCPVADMMDIMPHQLVRLAQIGFLDRGLNSEAIWQCVSCQTCSTRCPKKVNCAGVLDAFKRIAFAEKKVASSQRDVVAFQKAFLDNIRRNGRVNELELVAQFKIEGFLKNLSIPFLMRDAMLGPKMFAKGKLHLMPGSPVRDKAVVKRIFDRCME